MEGDCCIDISRSRERIENFNRSCGQRARRVLGLREITLALQKGGYRCVLALKLLASIGVEIHKKRGGPPSRSELLFIESVTPAFQDRRFLIPDSAYFERHNMEDWREVFFTEMLGYPDASIDDIVVAITQLVYLFETEKHRFERDERMGQRMLEYGKPTERAVAI